VGKLALDIVESSMVTFAQTGQELLTLKVGSFGRTVVFSPNGHWLASDADRKVKIYDGTRLPQKP
jgi:hypothetical protein